MKLTIRGLYWFGRDKGKVSSNNLYTTLEALEQYNFSNQRIDQLSWFIPLHYECENDGCYVYKILTVLGVGWMRLSRREVDRIGEGG